MNNNFLEKDSKNFQSQLGLKRYWNNICANPINDQQFIWKYIVCLRRVESCLHKRGFVNKLFLFIYLRRLRKLSYKTGFQIPPFTCGEGLTIWHWGSIIINQETKIGKNAVLNPGIVIGHKKFGKSSPIIGDNVFIGTGAKIIGELTIGNNVIIAPNAVVVNDVPSNCVVGGIPAKIINHINV